ncbi:MAG: M23 family metallopeptidase, partial [Anaerolineae bacterium]|nr:M23 family metallopeptidase [Anaerolineae bacterium]
MAAMKIFQVGPNQVRVRRQPGLQGEMVRWLDPGTQIECAVLSRREADGYVWWQHADGWSAERSTSSSEIYLFEATAAPTPSAPNQKLLRAGSSQVRVRSQPNLSGAMIRWLQPGELVEVRADSRREADGYVWWQHADGWSAERSIDGVSVFLIEVPPTPVVTQAPAPITPAPAAPTTSSPTMPVPVPAQSATPGEFQPPPPKKPFKVASVKVRVRRLPNLQGEMLGWLEPGTVFDADGNSRQETDGYVWWRHNDGWSAERNLAESEVYLVDPSVVVDIPAPRTNEPPSVDLLPLRDALFRQLPVAFDKILWWQYFGNNVYAWRIWQQGLTWYAYAQGLHGGLDFGNSRDRGVPVVAGVEGVFKYHDRVYTRPNGLWVKVGDYTVIYGHITNPRLYRVGDPIAPDTVLGELEFGGQNHLHLEVRYRDRWIINPLLLMPETMRSSL